ncbi:MAG: hypothetical protein JXR96_18930 [Deltaproteobacteria bacterium]|nr:hypothetical protein [Deltaproteobacteria bacterium]
MLRRSHWIGLFIPVAFLLASCGSSSGPSDGGPGADGSKTPCEAGQTRCVGMSYQECVDGFFQQSELCADPQVCAQGYGCVDCNPLAGKRCHNGDVYACNDDGSLGNKIEECGDAGCEYGACKGNDCVAESQLIYVVDNDYRLLSFDPSGGAYTFEELLDLQSICDPGPSWPAWGGGDPATPFSMSVDRDARAWVLFTSGEIMWVDIPRGTCQLSPFVKGASGFELFGMGFVSDAIGSEDETLFIAGGSVGSLEDGDLARVDPTSLAVTKVNPLPTPAGANSPELTGTGNAELYAYFPGQTTFVARLDKTRATIDQQWDLPPLGGTVRAWAFAHWGGKFYIFVTTSSGLGVTNSQVLRLDPASGQTETLRSNLPYMIVGAGVSTCAPVVEL